MYFCLFWIFKRSLAEDVANDALRIQEEADILKSTKKTALSLNQICFTNGAVVVEALRAFTNKGTDCGKTLWSGKKNHALNILFCCGYISLFAILIADAWCLSILHLFIWEDSLIWSWQAPWPLPDFLGSSNHFLSFSILFYG